MMTMKDRDRLRAKQDELLALADKAPWTFPAQRIYNHEMAPRLSQLEAVLWPDWEDQIDWAIRYLKGEAA